MLNKQEFAARRAQLMKHIGKTSIAIVKAAPIMYRNHYHEHAYRQDSDFHYLTGFDEPEAIAVFAPGRGDGEYILFSRRKDPDKEVWDGYRAGQEGAKKIYGADEAWPTETFAEKLPGLLENRDQIYYATGMDANFDTVIFEAINTLRSKVRSGVNWPDTFMDIQPILHEMRVIKSPAEIELMQKACDISIEGHIRAMRACKPGMYEYQLEAELTYAYLSNGSHAHAYTPIVGSGENACILHYVTNNKKIENGDMILIDSGCEYDYYASDITRTFPANGKFSAEQRAIYEVVLAAQRVGIEALHPGNHWDKIEETVLRVIVEGLRELKLLKGSVDEIIEKRTYVPFYMHRCGHWLGLDVHDAGRYKIKEAWRTLKPGMVRTMEPGVYISSNIPNVPKQWHNIGVRIEDDVLITENGNRVLSEKLPKEISDIENIMAGVNDVVV
ncbi:MAG: Xaa-Pro aminopeptidase [Gammaproteobacteria bacterium]|nr:Xaa-Pro aminopeptidase [Gammaproteobacteria bacterium]